MTILQPTRKKASKYLKYVLSEQGIEQLKSLQNEFQIVFQKYNYKYLFGKEEPIHTKTLIQFINRDLKHTSELYNLPYNIKSHSFRVNMISNLLKVTSVQNTAGIIGHTDIRSTTAYSRYALPADPIKTILTQMNSFHQTTKDF